MLKKTLTLKKFLSIVCLTQQSEKNMLYSIVSKLLCTTEQRIFRRLNLSRKYAKASEHLHVEMCIEYKISLEFFINSRVDHSSIFSHSLVLK